MKKTNHKKRIIFLTVTIVALLILSGGTYLYLRSQSSPSAIVKDTTKKSVNTIDYNNPSDAQKNPTTDNKNQKTDSTDNTSSPSQNLTVTITAANQNSNTLQVRALITPLIASGTCTITMTKSDQPSLSRTANIQPTSSSSTCEGFDIDISSLEKGTWNISIQVQSNNQSGSATRDVSLK